MTVTRALVLIVCFGVYVSCTGVVSCCYPALGSEGDSGGAEGRPPSPKDVVHSVLDCYN